MKVLVIGGTSLLGDRIVRRFCEGAEVWYTVNSKEVPIQGAGRIRMDITEPESVEKGFREVNPDIAVLVAAYTEVDACERNRERAISLNIGGAEKVFRACQKNGTKLVYISTDAIFDGTKLEPYTEGDRPNPPNFYARTKLEAEKIVLQSVENLVCRVSTIYGNRSAHHRQNVVMWMIETLAAQKRIELFEDRFCNPTFADEAADVIATIALRGGTGIFHTTGRNCVSRVELGRLVAGVFGLDENLIVPVRSTAYQSVPRGLHSCLSVTKAEQFIGRKIQTVEESLRVLKDQIEEAPFGKNL
ncbi:MAG: SDR family oxidoreductase [Thermoplasmata archaeon]|nr:SDR family oxidoreductase [Thermoplasmata archaeon]